MKIQLYSSLDLQALATMAGGRLILNGVEPTRLVSHICTDSREADASTLFCAIRGERVDGHDYVAKAAELGSAVFLCERIPDAMPAVYAAVLVPDTVEALGRLAAARRDGELRRLPVVAVTGSVGKTTTKEMIYAVLSSAGEIFKKDGNYNSTIGLPMSFMEIPCSAGGAVLEMGMSSRREISAMTAAVRPDVAVISNVGSSHLEYLGTRENIARAKLEIAEGLREDGALLINGDEPLLRAVGQDFETEKPVIPSHVRVLRLSLAGDEDADYTACNMDSRDGGMIFDLMTPQGLWRELWVPAVGEHMVWAAGFAAAVGQLRGLSEGQVKAGLAAYRPADMRQDIRTVAGVTIIKDCYNAAPESMHAALKVLGLTPASRRIAVLGDMKELGAQTAELHKRVGAEVARLGIDSLIAVGELGALIARGALEAGMPAEAISCVSGVDEYIAFAEKLASSLQAGDGILFKASRAMALEKMAEAVAEGLKG